MYCNNDFNIYTDVLNFLKSERMKLICCNEKTDKCYFSILCEIVIKLGILQISGSTTWKVDSDTTIELFMLIIMVENTFE